MVKISGQCWLHPILNRTPSEGSPSPLNLPSSTLKELRNLGETVHRYGPSPCTATLAYYRDIKQFPLLFPLWLAQKKHLGFLRRSVPWLVSRRWEKGQVALSHQQLNSNLPRASFVFSSFAFVALAWFGEWFAMLPAVVISKSGESHQRKHISGGWCLLWYFDIYSAPSCRMAVNMKTWKLGAYG